MKRETIAAVKRPTVSQLACPTLVLASSTNARSTSVPFAWHDAVVVVASVVVVSSIVVGSPVGGGQESSRSTKRAKEISRTSPTGVMNGLPFAFEAISLRVAVSNSTPVSMTDTKLLLCSVAPLAVILAKSVSCVTPSEKKNTAVASRGDSLSTATFAAVSAECSDVGPRLYGRLRIMTAVSLALMPSSASTTTSAPALKLITVMLHACM